MLFAIGALSLILGIALLLLAFLLMFFDCFFDFTEVEEPKQEEFKPIQEEIIEYEEPDELFDDTTDKVPVKRINENTVIDLKTGEVIIEMAQNQEEYINKLNSILGVILEAKL